MAAKELKTTPHDGNVREFLESVEPESKRKDSLELLEIFEKITSEPAILWGPSIVGFGKYRFKYASGQEGDWMITGFSPRKQNLVVYIMPGFSRYDELMSRLGKYKTGKSCLYINKLEDIDLHILADLIGASVQYMRNKYA
ncbi:MAG: DUF1801 domain-containing protein [Saprospiraceae bacterium]